MGFPITSLIALLSVVAFVHSNIIIAYFVLRWKDREDTGLNEKTELASAMTVRF